MQLNPAEISELIKSRIEGLAGSADIKNQGTVVSVADGICRVHGLSEVMAGEMLEFPPTPGGQATFGLALNLERDRFTRLAICCAACTPRGSSSRKRSV